MSEKFPKLETIQVPAWRLEQQQVPGRHHATARKKWSKEVNIVVMECYYRSNPIDDNGAPLKRYQQRMYRKWLQ